MIDLSRFSLVIRTITPDPLCPTVLVDATCDLCGHEFQVRNPTDARHLLNVLILHMKECKRIED